MKRIDIEGNEGIRILEGYSGTPSDGILEEMSIELPAYQRACFFAGDARNKVWGDWSRNANRVIPWAVTDLATIGRGEVPAKPGAGAPKKAGMAVMFHLQDGRVLLLFSVGGPETVSWFRIDEDGQLIICLGTLGTEPVNCDAPVLAWSFASDPYTACRVVWDRMLECGPLKGRVRARCEKAYAEAFEYLGWCSWEQYRKEITSEGLVEAIDQLEANDLPIRWVLVDDGHLDHTKGQLHSFEPNEKFPDDWAPITGRRDPEKIKWMGLWYCFEGYWENVHLENRLGELNDHLMEVPGGGLLPKANKESAEAFYRTMIETIKVYGYDFVKIDGQSRNISQYKGIDNAVVASANCSQALESATTDAEVPLINCMAQNSLLVCNTRESAVTRCSIDYKLGDAGMAKQHIHQSFHNTLWLGQTVWPDHDMFHSSDEHCGRMMAVTKALSGAPVYLSDAPEDIRGELVTPLCYESGKLLRPLAPAVPLPDSAFVDPLTENVAYRTIAPLANGCAAIAIYHLLVSEETEIPASITADDYLHAPAMLQPVEQWQTPPNGLVAFDHYNQTGVVLDGEFSCSLTGFDDRLFLLAPIQEGWAVIGRSDKYLGPATVESVEAKADSLQMTLIESGPIVVYSATGNPAVDGMESVGLGDGFWRIDLSIGAASKIKLLR